MTYDRQAAELARDDAIDRVDHAADDVWKTCARAAIRGLAETRPEFTTDAVWWVLEHDFGDPFTSEGRAMGPRMDDAQRRGWIERTDRTHNSVRVECHARPLRIWRSLIVGAE